MAQPAPFFYHPVVRIALATSLLVTSFAMYAPVIAVTLQQRGYSTLVIGAFAMIGFACIGVLMPFLPALCARFGEVQVYRVGAVFWFVAGLGYASTSSLLIWCVAAVVGGLGGAAVWNATEALIARYSPADRRGRITGLYQTLLGGALAVGPFVPAVFGIDGQQTLYAVCGVQAAALVLIINLPPLPKTPTGSNPTEDGSALSTWQALALVPGLALIAFVGGVFEAGLGSISAAHGAALGMSMAAAASVVGALGIGSFVCQYPAGILADHAPPARVFGMAATLLMASSLSVAFSDTAPWVLWACAFVWGGVGGALYTLTMIRVAHQFTGQNTAAGTAAMITGYTLGGAIGPVVSGYALVAFKAPGLSAWLTSLSLLVLFLAARWKPPKMV